MAELKKELLMIDVDYEADENLLPTLKMDLDSGCMTEEQQVYFSRGIAEVCTEFENNFDWWAKRDSYDFI